PPSLTTCPLFPYTTLFRSFRVDPRQLHGGWRRCECPSAGAPQPSGGALLRPGRWRDQNSRRDHGEVAWELSRHSATGKTPVLGPLENRNPSSARHQGRV